MNEEERNKMAEELTKKTSKEANGICTALVNKASSRAEVLRIPATLGKSLVMSLMFISEEILEEKEFLAYFELVKETIQKTIIDCDFKTKKEDNDNK